jgi:hypothetical protein
MAVENLPAIYFWIPPPAVGEAFHDDAFSPEYEKFSNSQILK